ncbi:META domain-containing protein [Streptomyces sp. CA-294286]|uniref:META domain-containing protein n=1 Tax=Streptomyces sp. CA-294286 TaxID=3240070 RepID=UPI003D946630
MQTKPKLRTRKMLTVPVTAVALLALGACGTETGAGSEGSGKEGGDDTVQTDVPLTGVRWSVESATVGGKKAPAPDGVYVRIDDKGAVTGHYGCNSFTGKATVKGDTVDFDKLLSTQIACEDQDFELAMRKALEDPLKAELDDSRLTLTTSKGGTIALTSKPVEPTAPLTGTKWNVSGFQEGETARSLPEGTGGKAYLTFGKDGTVRGHTGCNSLNGRAQQGDGTLEFGRVATTRMLCQGAEGTVEKDLLKVLTGKVKYSVDGRSLTLTAADGKGLEAKAAK